MSAIAHVLEAAGIATTSISLIRPHSEKMNTPRALWTTFELGRPFGLPNNPDFQREVLLAALNLLDRTDGPVLVDFPKDAPAAVEDEETGEGWACPVSFEQPVIDDRSELVKAVETEIRSLDPWYRMSLDKRGRTTFGLSGLDISGCVAVLTAYTESGTLPDKGRGRDDAETLRFAIEDIKTWYQEAATAKPGSPASRALMNWFWRETAMTQLMEQLRLKTSQSEDKAVKNVGERQLVPAAVSHG
ncbi:MAG: hypothetical protein RIC36_18265 [Rhodospirillales bacterium]